MGFVRFDFGHATHIQSITRCFFCHVLNRGNGRSDVFHQDDDFAALVNLMREAHEKLPRRLTGYCLLSDHFHLLLWPHEDGDLSRWMQWLMTSRVRRYHRNDQGSGHVWEGRFKATVLPSESAIAACMASVDSNPIRAGLAATPEKSDFTSAQERIADLKSAEEVSTPDAKDVRIEHGQNAGWLAPVELEPKRKKVREKCSSRRASNKGCVFMTLTEYLQLLDWTGRLLKPGKRGAIPKNAPPILDRLHRPPTTMRGLRVAADLLSHRT